MSIPQAGGGCNTWWRDLEEFFKRGKKGVSPALRVAGGDRGKTRTGANLDALEIILALGYNKAWIQPN
jgi:hypothetical protein